MKIAINCWVLRNKNLDGIGYFTVNAISRMIKEHPETEFMILCDKKFTEPYFDFPNVTKHYVFPALRHPVLYVLYLELIIPFFLRKHKPSLFLSMEGFLSLSSSCRQLPVIYDINFEHRPQDLKWYNRLYFGFFFRRFARKAVRIATISEYSKDDIASVYKIDPAKIDNVSCGINGNFRPLNEEEIKAARTRWSSGDPYFFFVGSMHPRKNIRRLMEAFILFKKNTKADTKLVLAGSILWSEGEIKELYEQSNYKDDIIFTGRLSDEELQQALGAAMALSFAPIFEGFGLPIVEAMQSRVPVICSNITSMPEVAGTAALLVDPYQVNEIAGAMEKLNADQSLREELVTRGDEQKLLFSWERTAALLWDSVAKAASGS